MGSIDGVKMFVESTVTSDHVKDGSVARFVLNVVVVELTNDGELIRSNDGVSVSMFVLDPFGGIESLKPPPLISLVSSLLFRSEESITSRHYLPSKYGYFSWLIGVLLLSLRLFNLVNIIGADPENHPIF